MPGIDLPKTAEVIGHLSTVAGVTAGTYTLFDFSQFGKEGNAFLVSIDPAEGSSIGIRMMATWGLDVDPGNPAKSTGLANLGTGLVFEIGGAGDTIRVLLIRTAGMANMLRIGSDTEVSFGAAAGGIHVNLLRLA